MKIRIITGLVAAAVPVSALVFLQYPLLGFILVPFAALGAYEICHVAGMKNKPMIAAATIMAALVPSVVEYGLLGRLRLPLYPVLLGYFLLLVALMLARFKETRFSHLLYALLASLAFPGTLAAILLLRDLFKAPDGAFIEQNLAAFFLFFAFCCAWLTDVFAYFVGVNFGKHKLCPSISPKKSVEGAAGALVLTPLANAGFAAMFNAFFLTDYRINLLAVGLLSVPVCVASMLGDLTASTLKRSYGVKDFGRLFPGHGGVIDRCDSFTFVAPVLLAVMQLAQVYAPGLFYRAAA